MTGPRAWFLEGLYGGHLWFAAGAVVIIVVALDLARVFRGRAVGAAIGRIVILLALAIAALTGTPLPLILAIPLVVSLLLYGHSGFERGKPVVRRALGIAVILLGSIAIAIEGRQHFRTPPPRPPATRVVVIGDSITSGGFGERERWVERMGVSVIDLSLPSETLASAVARADEIEASFDPTTEVVIELGGNDMLEGIEPQRFAEELERLFQLVEPHQRRVTMFELPVLPGRWPILKIQRELAARYGVVLIPRRVLAEVLTREGLTFDGLHLSDAGHARIAQRVAPWLGW